MRNALAALLSVAFLSIIPATARPWGNAPTHFSMGFDVALSYPLPPGIDGDVFIRAHACPDIANTQLFKSNHLGFVHTLDFAEALYETAARRNNDRWRATALAWGSHLVQDVTGHSAPGAPSYIPPDDPLHSLVEISVDTILYYFYYQGTPPLRDPVNVTVADCDPRLIREASILYKSTHADGKIVWNWQSWWAVHSLAAVIEAEYGYIKAKGDSGLSEAFLADLCRRGILPSDSFLPYYVLSVENAVGWISTHP